MGQFFVFLFETASQGGLRQALLHCGHSHLDEWRDVPHFVSFRNASSGLCLFSFISTSFSGKLGWLSPRKQPAFFPFSLFLAVGEL